jgi:hypothetical protein
MKMIKSILAVLMIMLCGNIFAQKSFEGEIIYKNVSKFDTSKNGIIRVFLKGNKMLVSNEIKSNDIPTYTLYDFEKGKSFITIQSDTVVITNALMESPFKEIIDSTKNGEFILGYNCLTTSYKVDAPMSNYISSIDAFFSNKILFRVPVNMRFITPPFIFFNDSCISVGVKMKSNKMPGADLKNIELEYKAFVIQERILDETLFEIPKYMKEKSAIEYSEDLMERFNKVTEDLGSTNKEIEASMKKMLDTKKQKQNTQPKTSKKKILKKKSL